MVKHIVMWKFKDSAEGATKEQNLRRVFAELKALQQTVPSIRTLEIGLHSSPKDQVAWDLVLYSEFDDWDGLEEYIRHPEHKKIAEFIGKVRSDRAAVDYEV
jgi:hypothetical protein